MPDITGDGITTCPQCGAEDVGVVDSRVTPWGRRRRRSCFACGGRWTTTETMIEGRAPIGSGLERVQRMLGVAAREMLELRRSAGWAPASEFPDPLPVAGGEDLDRWAAILLTERRLATGAGIEVDADLRDRLLALVLGPEMAAA